MSSRVQSPRLTDVAVATATAVLAIAGLLLLPVLQAAEPTESIESPTTAGWWLTVAAIVAQAIALLWAALSPRVVLVVVAGLPVVLAIAAPSSILSLTTLAITVAVFLAVVRVPLRSLSITLPIAAVLVAISQFVNEAGRSLDAATLGIAALQAVVVVGVPLVIGLYFAARKDARVSRGNEIVALKRERDALVQAAVSRERIAMSRELHDIAAHHMSGIALLASAIYRQVDLDPEAAKIAAQQVRAQSTTVLDDLRRVIGLLRDEAESTRTVETLAAIPELVELRRATGAEVELVVHATDHELGTGVGPLAQLVAYRMVQESLANASTHAPGAKSLVEVDDRESDRLTLTVTNDSSATPDLGPGGGFGLVGMRERAELVDADLSYGATADGGWQVRLTLRREAIIDSVTGSAATEARE